MITITVLTKSVIECTASATIAAELANIPANNLNAANRIFTVMLRVAVAIAICSFVFFIMRSLIIQL
jgi:hypothetical protein